MTIRTHWGPRRRLAESAMLALGLFAAVACNAIFDFTESKGLKTARAGRTTTARVRKSA